jgi:hypothetical protein
MSILSTYQHYQQRKKVAKKEILMMIISVTSLNDLTGQ